MLAVDKSAVVCDLCETYGVFCMHDYPPRLIAALACGLRVDSRIRMKIDGRTELSCQLMMASISDYLQVYLKSMSKDKELDLFTDKIFAEKKVKKKEKGFKTGADFDKWWKEKTKERSD